MRPIHAVPLLTLAALSGVAWLAVRSEQPFTFAFEEPPPRAPLAAPEVPAGDAALFGTLRGAGDRPVARAMLSVEHRGRLIWTHSDAAGGFRLGELDAGPVEVAVLARGYPPVVLTAAAGEESVVLRLPEPHDDPPAALAVERTDLTGRVEAPRVDDELFGYEVLLVPLAPPSAPGAAVPRRATTDAEGVFEFPDLAHGAYRARLLPAWARGGSWPDVAVDLDSPATPLEHPPARSLDGGELFLRDRSGGVRVHMLGPAPDGGRLAVEGALLVLRAAQAGETNAKTSRVWPPAATDAAGIAVLRDVPPGKYTLSMTAGAYHQVVEIEIGARATKNLDIDIGP